MTTNPQRSELGEPSDGLIDPLEGDVTILGLSSGEASLLRASLASLSANASADGGLVRVAARDNPTLGLTRLVGHVLAWATLRGLRFVPISFGRTTRLFTLPTPSVAD